MDQAANIIKTKDAFALIEEDVNENSFMKLIDTLLLTVINVTSGIGKISKTLIGPDILEFIIEMPLINTNVIIQYDFKMKEQTMNKNFYLENIPETISYIEKEANEYHSESEYYCGNGGELQVAPYESNLAEIDNSNYTYDKMIISCNENLNNHEDYRIIPISNVGNEISDVSTNSGSRINKFSSSDNVATNKKSRVSKERYHCSVCGKPFTSLANKNIHERFHSGERPFSCEVCGKSFSIVSDKKRHERIHTGEKPYSCAVCGKTFVCLSNKNTHERVHSGERPYSCSVCGKSFSIASHKKRHERIHTGEKPYSCSVCGKSFTCSTHKNTHERIHSGERPFSCGVCGKTFSIRANKIRHEKGPCSQRMLTKFLP